MRCRQLLALAGLLALALMAGCSAPGSISMQAVDDQALAEETSRAVAALPSESPDLDPAPREFVVGAIENGSATVTAQNVPLGSDLPVAYRGAYYDLNHEVIGTKGAYRLSVGVDYNGSDPDGAAVDYADLPAVDRSVLDAVLPQRHPGANPGPDVGVGAIYSDAELNRSVLAEGDVDVVVFEGDRYPVEVESPEPVELRVYRYTATRVAPNASAYAAQLRQQYAFELTGLTEAERAIVETAVEEGSYYAESTDDAAFESLLEHVRDRPAVDREETYGTWLVRYEGELYLADLHFGGFART